MKKTFLTIAIVLGISLSTYAQWGGGGLFQYGEVSDEDYYGSIWYALDQNNARTLGNTPLLPGHGQSSNQDAAPLGGGALLLIGFGAAYALKKNTEYRRQK